LCGLDNHSANLDNHSESRHATPMTSPLPETIELRCDSQPVPYREALALMEARNMAIAEGTARELVWLLEHPPV
jgi:lipoate-protein ligase B